MALSGGSGSNAVELVPPSDKAVKLPQYSQKEEAKSQSACAQKQCASEVNRKVPPLGRKQPPSVHIELQSRQIKNTQGKGNKKAGSGSQALTRQKAASNNQMKEPSRQMETSYKEKKLPNLRQASLGQKDAHKKEKKVPNWQKETSYKESKQPNWKQAPHRQRPQHTGQANHQGRNREQRPGSYQGSVSGPKLYRNHCYGEGNKSEGKCKVPGFKQLEELATKDPSEVVLIVANTRNGYSELFNCALRPDLMVLVIKVLAKVCQVDFKENKATVLASACNAKFLEQLAYHIATIPTDTNPERKAGVQGFFHDLLLFCGTVMNLLPNTACEHLGPILILVKGAISSASAFQSITFTKALINKQIELEVHLKKLLEEREKKPMKESSRNETLKYQPPPDDFRDLSIFPLSEDILTREKAFIRPNIIEGAYRGVDHYLDVQFRLLREDFVWPLRDGITDYMEQLAISHKVKRKTNNIRIYHKVHFLSSTVQKDRIGFVVSFDKSSTSGIKWEHSKRFMFGSLLCFTSDKFGSVMFGTVLDRKIEDLARGIVTVELSHESDSLELFHSEFIMVESEVYFEPYYHVLKALQVMKREDFPMCQYIVHVQSETQSPQYVLEKPQYPYLIQDFEVTVLAEEAWPSAVDLAFDDSQYQAFKSALTKEFVVIQGPPGAGKTYLGLKIARTMITNINNLLDSPSGWLEEHNELLVNPVDSRRSPLLVVCFTNHALDQFLEGLLETTTNIVRVGGQSRSDILKPYNLKEKRLATRRSNNMRWLSRDIHERMSQLMSRIKGIQRDLEMLDTNYGIISIASIAEVCHLQNMCFVDEDGKLSDESLLTWLVPEEEMVEQDIDWSRKLLTEMDSSNSSAMGDELLPQEEIDQYEEWQRGPQDEFDLEVKSVDVKLKFAFKVTKAKEDIKSLESAMIHLQEARDPEMHIKFWMLATEQQKLVYRLRQISDMLKNKPQQNLAASCMLLRRNVYLWGLSYEQRWTVYWLWVGQLRKAMLEELRHIEAEYRTEARQFQETRHMEDLTLIRGADVIGMTTTGAARLQPLLQALKCRIVVVEEAAEVMESHIVVSLTSHCQHLILIGDHQQLRPTTAVYRLARDFHFDISLFERMLRNGLHCEVLKVQHRMRPEIARLIVPSIYKELHNHDSVLHFEPVRGVTKSLFFLTHDNREQEVGETHSRRNTFEADMLLGLCRYLLLQGYPPDRITILTTYSGQMFYLRNARQKSPSLKDVQMTIVDNFQGEENDIILLSLVRNNEENNVGFLKTENRVCVALSRAKHGLYIMGNMNNLTSSSSVWPRIKEELDEQQAVGDHLTLCCPVHKDQLTEVRSAADFAQVPEGGCQLPCAAVLSCGHTCVSVCHAPDREHKKYNCRNPCTRAPPGCGLEHPCPKLCFEECGDCMVKVERQLPCGHIKLLPCYVDHVTYKCQEKVSFTAADCSHTFDKPCYQDADSCVCPHPCDIRLDCGHSCAQTCHVGNDPGHVEYKCRKACTKKNAGCTQDHMCARKCHEECGACCVPVKKKAPRCDHIYTIDCSLDAEFIKCELRCEKMLECGHPCRLQCYQQCGQCTVMVRKTVADSDCGHKVKVKCSETPQRRHCTGPCQRKMSCGHHCDRTCKVVCSTSDTCEQLVATNIKPACGHNFEVYCRIAMKGLAPDSAGLLRHCREPCNTRLECGHLCKGTCGLCLQGRIHQGCRAKCGRNLVCGHVCSVPCAQSCPPCQKKCRLRCQHSRCNKNCGVPCTRCQEPCNWRCPHKSCTKRCGEMCNREPCNEPCKKLLRCKHPCIGFCGDPCPRLCRICNKDEVTTIIFGNEDEPDARFVYLVDCNHTIESRALETWLNQNRAEVILPQCPLCKTDIMTTMRFMNRVKQILRDVCAIKRKIFGDFKTIEKGKTQLLDKLKAIRPVGQPTLLQQRGFRFGRIFNFNTPQVDVQVGGSVLTPAGLVLYNKLMEKLRTTNNYGRITLSSVDLHCISTQLEIFTEMLKCYDKVRMHMTEAPLQTLNQHTDMILSVLTKRDRINPQEITDFNLELRRYQCIAQLCQLETKMKLDRDNQEAMACFNTARSIAFSIEKYSDDQDKCLRETVQKLSDILKASLKIVELERREIVKAVGLRQGHWFKCPNGHYYAIGECGGAMEESRCPDCGAAIGGTQHRLLPNNRLASEIDGATSSAWPGAAMNP